MEVVVVVIALQNGGADASLPTDKNCGRQRNKKPHGRDMF